MVKMQPFWAAWLSISLMLLCQARSQVRREHVRHIHSSPQGKAAQMEVKWRGSLGQESIASGTPKEDYADGRPPPAYDILVLNQELTALREAGPSNEDEMLVSNLPEKRMSKDASEDQICAPTALGGERLVGDPAYQAQVQSGQVAASSKGIIFAGLMRDVGDSVGSLVGLLHKTGQAFARHHTIIVEGNSKDSTKANLEKECNFKQVSCFNLDIKQLQGVFRVRATLRV